ncbi:hypothetical protein IFR05_004850 [Cadophora sp. M221]|nr:hypothetical protein IFR05_004850 [Cadophora sp. M221]
MVQPFFVTPKNLASNILSVIISRDDIGDLGAVFECGFRARLPEDLQKEAEDLEVGGVRNFMASERYKEEEMRFEKSERQYLHDQLPHPSRTSSYDVFCLPQKEVWYGRPVDWPMVDLMRYLSNVSVKFRHELAEVVWENVEIRIYLDFVLDGTLQDFLTDRSAIHGNINVLELSINTSKFEPEIGPMLEKALGSGSALTRLELSTLRIIISIVEVELEDFVTGAHWLHDIKIIRHINVTKSFELRLDLRDTGKGMNSWEDEKKHRNSLEAKYQPLVQGLLMPYSLASPPVVSGQRPKRRLIFKVASW